MWITVSHKRGLNFGRKLSKAYGPEEKYVDLNYFHKCKGHHRSESLQRFQWHYFDGIVS